MIRVKVEGPLGVSEEDIRQWFRLLLTAVAPNLEPEGDVRVFKRDQCRGRLHVDVIFGPADFIANISKSVDEIEMSVRSVHGLKELGIRTVEDLMQKSESELLRARNFGRKSLAEVKRTLYDMGLSLGMMHGEDELKMPLERGN